MSRPLDFERRVAAWVADEGASTPPVRVLDEILTATGRQRPLPRWLALIKEPPMRISSRVAVGSPTTRLATLLAATLVLALLGAGAVVAGASYLAGSGPIVVDADDPSAYQTISAAVDAAVDGDTILVRPGVYPESITITEDITLRGDSDDRADVVIEIPSDGPTFLTEFGPLIFGLMIEASGAEVSDLSVRPMTGADLTQYSALVVSGGAPRIHGVTVAAGSAVWIMGASTAAIADSSLGGIVFINDRSSPTVERNEVGAHVGVFNAGAAEPAIVRENHAVGVTIDGPAVVERNVIRLGDEPDEPVSDFFGIDARSGDGWIVRDNDVSGFATGIDVRLGSSGLIEGNILADNTTGILARTTDTEVVGNVVRGGETGIRTEVGVRSVVDNTVKGAGIGVEVRLGSSPTLSGNTLCGNGVNLSIAEGAEPVLETNEICEDGLVTAGG
jgi:hypothetical protein